MEFLFDTPIKCKEQDLLHRSEFAKHFAENLVALSQGECFTVALNGCWGSGKTSLINLIKEHLEYLINYDESLDFYPVIIDFSPWNALEENAIIRQFFDGFTSEFPMTKLKNFLKNNRTKLAIKILEDIPHLGKVIKEIHKLFNRYFKSFIGEDDDLLKIKNSITQKLAKSRLKYIVFIDDIDRLNNKEIKLLMQLIKAVCDFPNVVYVLAFDRDIVASALDDEQKIDGDEYLEKIIQLTINVPEMNQDDLQQYLFKKLDGFCNDIEEGEFDSLRWGSIYRNGYGEYFKTFRDVNRYINSLQFKVESYKKVLNIVDLFTIEAIALFEPKLLNIIFEFKEFLCQSKYFYDNKKEIEKLKSAVEKVSQNYNILANLFPAATDNYSSFNYEGTRNIYEIKARGRICDIGNLEYYFAGQLYKNAISREIVRKVLYENSPEQNEQFFNSLTNKAYSLFLQFLYGFSREKKNSSKIVDFLPKLLEYNPAFEDLTGMVVVRNIIFINGIIDKIFEFNGKAYGIKILKSLYQSSKDYNFLVDNLYDNAMGTGYYSHSKDGESKFTVGEIDEFHNILISRLSQKIYEEDFLLLSNVIQILLFIKEKNIDLLKSWYESQKDNLLNIIEKLVNIGYGEGATRFRIYQFYHDVFDEFIDVEQVREEIKQFLAKKPKDYPSENIIGKILFLMPVRKEEPYTLAEIKAFCIENNIEFSYTDKFVDE